MLIIGFGSKSRHGKDTAATAIKDFYDNDFMSWNDDENRCTVGNIKVGIFKFATALYQEVNEYLEDYNYRQHVGTWQNFSPGFDTNGNNIMIPDWVQPDPQPEISELAPYGKHPKLLQFWGTDYRRAQDADYWVKRLFRSIPSDIDIALISDVRFPNEADAIKFRGGYNVNVIRQDSLGKSYVSSDRPADHVSETSLDNYMWDIRLINNEGHRALLGEQAITLAEYLRGLNE